MNTLGRTALVVVVMLAGLAWAVPACAHGYGHRGGGGYWIGPRVSFYYGAPLWWGAPYYYYGAPYAYAPPPTPAPAAPVTYIERGEPMPSAAPPAQPGTPPAASAPGSQWWYLCASPRGAYPYVRECPGGWERVPAVPPADAR